jgi:selenocysteine lyase/cysteine desulfurase
MTGLEIHFKKFFEDTIGHDAVIETPFGRKKLVYADWAASGRLYGPVEQKLLETFGPLVANTHTESNTCGEFMTHAYHEARDVIKKHVGANHDDVLLASGSGMTSAVVLLQRLLGWRIPEQYTDRIELNQNERPIVFVSEMEHHSNHTTWIETISDVVVVPSNNKEPFDLEVFEDLLKECKNHKTKIAAVTAASNVTGVTLPVHDIAALIHKYGGLCFVDYTCAAPYTSINMHPKNESQSLDAIYFSPHKFLGGPGTPGILIFDQALYHNEVPDRPGGGTVSWTNPWGGRRYFNDIETREDGGTPPFLGLIKTALAISLKEKMGMKMIKEREEQLVAQLFDGLLGAPGLSLLDSGRKKRLALFAFTIEGLHYNLVTRLLNDRFGIQARGGCACAGTYGHCLFKIPQKESSKITDRIDHGDLSEKPGFTRISLHPTTDNKTAAFIISSIKEITQYGKEWAEDYIYDPQSNEFIYKFKKAHRQSVDKIFSI